MSKSREKQETAIGKLRAAWAAAQAAADALRAKLARAEARLAGEPTTPECGLDQLWAAAPPMARTRSSKHQCRTAWLRIPAAERPRVSDLLEALRLWSRCAEWKKDDGQFVPGLHRWLRDHRWQDIPDDVRPRPRATRPEPAAPAPPIDPATPEYIASICAIDWEKRLHHPPSESQP